MKTITRFLFFFKKKSCYILIFYLMFYILYLAVWVYGKDAWIQTALHCTITQVLIQY